MNITESKLTLIGKYRFNNSMFHLSGDSDGNIQVISVFNILLQDNYVNYKDVLTFNALYNPFVNEFKFGFAYKSDIM